MSQQQDLSLNITDVGVWARYSYPLSVIRNADPLTPDLRLDDSLPESGIVSYRLLLDPFTAYRFSTEDAQALANEPAVVLLDAESGAIHWANTAAIQALEISAPVAEVFSSDVYIGAEGVVASLVAGSAASLRTMAGLSAFAASASGAGSPSTNTGFNDPAHYTVAVEAQAPVYTHDTVTRFLKTATQQYFYTANQAEADLIRATQPEFRWEGTTFSVDHQERPGWDPIFRFADLTTGGYFYTGKLAEADAMGARLRAEGIAFWAPQADTPGAAPVYRLFNMDTGGYLFTANPVEKLYAVLQGNWRDEGVAFGSLIDPLATDAAMSPALTADVPGIDVVGVAAVPDVVVI